MNKYRDLKGMRAAEREAEQQRSDAAPADVPKQTAYPSPVEAMEQVIASKDAAYRERNQLVALLAAIYPSGTRRTAIPGWSKDWHGCVYIDLPTGQASWHYHDTQASMFAHLPAYNKPWDGHTTEEKYERVRKLSKMLLLGKSILDTGGWPAMDEQA